MKAIMYHYVRKYNDNFPNFRFLDVSNFVRQLDYFGDSFGFVDRDEWSRVALEGDFDTMPPGVILTFDDAMSCHYEFVFEILRKRGLWGIFYVPTKPYVSNKMLDVHRIHLLCGRFDGEKLLDACMSLIDEEMIPFTKREKFIENTYQRQHNAAGVSQFKRMLNYFVDESYKSEVIDELSSHFGFNDYDMSFYVGVENLSKMSKEGMVVGSHTVNHPVMSKLDRGSQAAEIRQSFQFLESVCDTSHRTYCHPYGGFHSFNDETISLLDECDVSYSFSVESRDITGEDLLNRKQCLPRYNCNEFSYGRAS